MKNKRYKFLIYNYFAITALLLLLLTSCHKEEDLELAKFSNDPTVYIDAFTGGLNYFPFADSKQTAFSVDDKTFYKGTSSMRFDIPNVGDPEGAYAGAIFPVPDGRNLTEYDALTFWAKGTQPGTINEIGFGNDFGENKFLTTLPNLQLTTNWKKYTIPLPDPSRLVQEKGLFWYAEGPENEKGYSFWVDEVQYEKLGTVAQPRPAILNGEDQTQTSFVGVTIQLSGLTQTFNLENGEDVTVNPAPSYFSFISSNPAVATVSENGRVSVVGSGTAVITATLGGQEAEGSLTIESIGEFSKAPVPTRDPSSVISIFSDAYTNVPVDFYNGYFAPFQTTIGQDDIDIGGDKIIKYSLLNFVATEFKNPTVNASAMTHFHVDIQIEDETILPEDFIRIQLGDFGGNNVFDGGDDSNGSYTITSQNLERGKWLSFDIPLSEFRGLTSRSNLAQIFFISDGTNPDLPGTITDILVDNMYFYAGEVIQSPTFPLDFENGETLTGAFDGGANGFNTDNPDQSGINTSSKVYQFNKVAGSEWYSGVFHIFNTNIDPGKGSAFKFKIWSPKENINVRFQLEKEGADGNPPNIFIDQTLTQSNTWVEMTFDFSNTPLNLSNGYDKIVIFPDFNEGNQVPVPSDVIYYLDDIDQSEGEGGNSSEPSESAPDPSQGAGDVISIFSDAYSNVAGTDFFPNWGQATVVTEEMINGNNTLKYSGLNYQGIVLNSNLDVSGMDFLHIDYWTANSTLLNAFIISPGPVETGIPLMVPTGGSWNSIDIPLEDFSPVDLMDVFQMKFDGNGDIYLDNIYFYKSGGGMQTMPDTPAPEPTHDASNVISVYSDAYSNVDGTDFFPDWGQATVVSEEMINGNNTLKYTGLNYQGIVLGSNQDVSAMEFLHIDLWTANSSALSTFIISTGPIETGVALNVPTGGSWRSVDIPLTDFSPVDLMDVFQMKFDGNGDIYLDNIYFYKSDGSSGGSLFPIDFEDGGSLTGAFDGGANGANADNPDQSGINTSAKVYQFNKVVGSAWYSGTYNIFDQDIDASQGSVFKFKIWSPKADINIRFQLEKEGNQGAIPTFNLDQTITEANQWVELTFDFSGTPLNLADGYDKIVIFPDFDESNQNPVGAEAIYFIDDIIQE